MLRARGDQKRAVGNGAGSGIEDLRRAHRTIYVLPADDQDLSIRQLRGCVPATLYLELGLADDLTRTRWKETQAPSPRRARCLRAVDLLRGVPIRGTARVTRSWIAERYPSFACGVFLR